MVLSAYTSFTIPVIETGIPFTAQSLVIFVAAGLLKPTNFLAAIILYLILGVAGLPVFAEGSSGWSRIVGSSGGFLYGFIFSGLVISYCASTLEEKTFPKLIGLMILGTGVLFVFGLGHLSYKFGIEKALEYGLYPFWKMALVKAILAGIAVFVLKRPTNS